MRISKKDAKLLLVLLAVIIFIAGYFVVYSPYTQKAEKVEAEIAALKPELDVLQKHYDNLSVYETGIDESYATIEDTLGVYPADVRTEDLLIYAIELEKNTGVDIRTLAFSGANPLAAFDVVKENDGGFAVTPYSGSRTAMTATCALTYAQLKDLIDYVNSTPMRTTLDSVAVSYDASTGGLSGTLAMSKYFISTEGQEYEPTKVPKVSLGKDALFDTITITPGG